MKTIVCIVLLAATTLAAPAPKDGQRDKRSFISSGWDSGLSSGWYGGSLGYGGLGYGSLGYGGSYVSAPIIETAPAIVSEPIVVKKIVSVPKVIAVKKIVSYAPALSQGWW